jgi:biopolymer transport protein ExbD
MANIDTGSGHGGKKAVDLEIPLVPFIDLLLCCVMFLLVTAVWNQLGALNAQSTAPTPTADALPAPVPETPRLLLEVHHDGYRLSGDSGVFTDVPAPDGALYELALSEALTAYREVAGTRDVVLLPDDDVNHGDVMTTMDTLVGQGYASIVMGSGWNPGS